MEIFVFLFISTIIFSVFLCVLLLGAKKKLSEYKIRFSNVINADEEIKKVYAEKSDIETKLEELRKSYEEKYIVFKKLSDEIKIYEDNLEILEFGMHSPSFNYDSSERYKNEIIKIRNRQKEMIKEKTAIYANNNWFIGGSATEGKKMINRIVKIALRAFNGECDASIANVKWNNYEQMFMRIEKSKNAINELISWSGCYIREDFFNLKIEELEHVHLYAEKKQEEKEAQRIAQEKIREEERAQREFEKAQRDAEREEIRYNLALEQAKKDLEGAHGTKLDSLHRKIEELQHMLAEAQKNKERAISMAQQTKRGHVYVISNIGSFGENIYKIGMTRRLDPTERVKELGDASVPFSFDIHAMIYSENAPQLETALHKRFWNNRVNYVNDRREFFNINLNEIEEAVKENGAEIEFIKIPEAKEFRETISIKSINSVKEQSKTFPTSI